MSQPLPKGAVPPVLVTKAAFRPRATLVVSGTDRVSFLTRVMSGELSRPPGAARTALLGPKGNVIAACVATVLNERIVLETDAARGPALYEGLDRYRVADDVELSPRLREVELPPPGGQEPPAPPARGLVAAFRRRFETPPLPQDRPALLEPKDRGGQCFRTTVEGPEAWNALSSAVFLSVGNLRLLRPGEVQVFRERTHRFLCVRRDFRPWEAYTVLAGPGSEGSSNTFSLRISLRHEAVREENAARYLYAAEAEYLRIAAGEPAWGAELDERSLPLMSGLADHVRLGKGCYIGQEYVARQAHRGRIPRLLRVLELEGRDAPPPGSRVTAGDGDRPVGTITSAASPPEGFDTPAVALAVLRAEVGPGDRVAIRTGAGPALAATVRRDGEEQD